MSTSRTPWQGSVPVVGTDEVLDTLKAVCKPDDPSRVLSVYLDMVSRATTSEQVAGAAHAITRGNARLVEADDILKVVSTGIDVRVLSAIALRVHYEDTSELVRACEQMMSHAVTAEYLVTQISIGDLYEQGIPCRSSVQDIVDHHTKYGHELEPVLEQVSAKLAAVRTLSTVGLSTNVQAVIDEMMQSIQDTLAFLEVIAPAIPADIYR